MTSLPQLHALLHAPDAADGAAELDSGLARFADLAWLLLVVLLPLSVQALSVSVRERDAATRERDAMRILWDSVSSTPAAEQLVQRLEALVELQRQRLLVALLRVEQRERARLALRAVGDTRDDSPADALLDAAGDVGPRVADGFRYARVLFGPSGAAQRHWTAAVLADAGLRDAADAAAAELLRTPDRLTAANRAWLASEVALRLRNARTDCERLQQTAVAELQARLAAQPGRLQADPAAQRLVERYLQADPEVQAALLPRIQAALHAHARMLLSRQGLILLGEV